MWLTPVCGVQISKTKLSPEEYESKRAKKVSVPSQEPYVRVFKTMRTGSRLQLTRLTYAAERAQAAMMKEKKIPSMSHVVLLNLKRVPNASGKLMPECVFTLRHVSALNQLVCGAGCHLQLTLPLLVTMPRHHTWSCAGGKTWLRWRPPCRTCSLWRRRWAWHVRAVLAQLPQLQILTHRCDKTTWQGLRRTDPWQILA